MDVSIKRVEGFGFVSPVFTELEPIFVGPIDRKRRGHPISRATQLSRLQFF